MERLTYWSEEYNCWCYDGPIGEAANHLAAYEDTGLEPEDIEALRDREQGFAELLVNVSCGCAVSYTRLEELAQAEKDGRLVVLDEDVILAMSAGARAILNNKRLQGVTYVYDCFGELGGPKEISYLKAAEILYRIGSTYLARKEAETALKKKEED